MTQGPTSGNISVETHNTNSKEHKHLYVPGSIIYNCLNMEAARCPSIDEKIKQLWDVYTKDYYLAIKKEENFILCNNMDGPEKHYAK